MQAHLDPNPAQQRYSTNFIEWDDTPSFASALSQFGLLMPGTPFREPLSGLAVREVTDADVFRHFFGP
jgi:hypothetical protein